MGLIAASSPFPTLASRGTHLSPSLSSSSVFKTRAGNSPLAVRDPAKGRDPECCSPRFNELIKRYFAQLPDSSSPLQQTSLRTIHLHESNVAQHSRIFPFEWPKEFPSNRNRRKEEEE